MPKRYRTETGFRPSRIEALRRTQTRRPRASGRRSRNALVKVPRNKIGFPQSMQSQLRFCKSLDFTPNSATIGVKTFVANGMYDPDAAVGGHQPRGFDEFMNIYQKFTVKSARVSVTWTYEGYNGPSGQMSTTAPAQAIQSAAGGVQAVPAIVGMVIPSAEASLSGEVSQVQELEKAVWTHITPSGEARTIVSHASPRDFFGKDFLVGADGYTGTDSGDPLNKIYFHLAAGQQSNEYPITIKVRANICITYDAVFTEPKYLGES